MLNCTSYVFSNHLSSISPIPENKSDSKGDLKKEVWHCLYDWLIKTIAFLLCSFLAINHNEKFF